MRVSFSMLALLAAVAAPSSASAAVTVGTTAVAPTSASPCLHETTIVQATEPSIGPSYAMPTDGVVTAWSTRTDSPAPSSSRLVIVRPTGTTGTYSFVAQSAEIAPAPAQVNTATTRLSVKQGDRLALGGNSAGFYNCLAPSLAGYSVDLFYTASVSELTPGTHLDNYSISLSAELEPDADADGFG